MKQEIKTFFLFFFLIGGNLQKLISSLEMPLQKTLFLIELPSGPAAIHKTEYHLLTLTVDN